MKTILITLFCLFTLFAKAQTTPNPIGKFIIIDKLAIEGAEKKEIYSKTAKWCTTRFKTPATKAKKKTVDAEPIVVKAWHDIAVAANAGNVAVQMYYTLEIIPGDSTINYRVYDIHYKTYPDEYTNYTSTSFTAEMLFAKDNLDRRGQMQPILKKYSDATSGYIKTLMTDLKLAIGGNETIAKK